MTRSASPEETIALGRQFARQLRPGDVVALSGNLGSGKTHFISGVCEGLGAQMHATSPTFTLINEYDAPFGKVVHVDLYRINKSAELRELGIEEYFNERCICLIEWPEVMAELLPVRCFDVRIEYGASDNERLVEIEVRRTPFEEVVAA
jgi:tRNA threonylcarbamoyladenosine biosynthesis protein TsaE